MCRRADPAPIIGSRFRVNLFWLGKFPMIKGKPYKLKIASTRVVAELRDVVRVIDASELSSVRKKEQLDRHDIGECILETSHPIAYDPVGEIEGTGRFVIVDDYEIAAGGVVLEKLDGGQTSLRDQVERREFAWDRGYIGERERMARNHHRGRFLLIAGDGPIDRHRLAKAVEKSLFNMRLNAYYLGLAALSDGLDADVRNQFHGRDEHIRRLGELARIMADAGLIFISAVADVDSSDLERLRILSSPHEAMVVMVGGTEHDADNIALRIPDSATEEEAVSSVLHLMYRHHVIPEYCI
jgi:bifunctional enzyme CysN/CysC